MRQRAGGRGAIVGGAGIGPVDELFERLGRNLRSYGDGKFKGCHLRQGFEIGDRIVAQRVIDMLVDRDRRNRREQMVLPSGGAPFTA